jgi:hypothetical protein
MRRLRTLALAPPLAALLAAPTLAEAHLVATGLGPLYDGVSHFGLSPEDMLPVAALALFVGLKGPAPCRAAGLALPGGWLLGGIAGLAGLPWPPLAASVASAAMLLAAGGLLAWNLKAGPRLCAAAALGLGLVCGLGDVAGVAVTPAHLVSLAGMASAAAVVFVLAASLTLPLTRLWMIVAARVAGSWMAALGLLVAGWVIRYGALAR